jgi:homoserine dehydrogenase
MFAADLVLVGFGNVARRFVRLLDERAAELRGDHGLDWRVIAVATLRHGSVWNLRGIETARALEVVERGGSLAEMGHAQARRLEPQGSLPASSVGWIEDVAVASRASDSPRPLVIVETTVLDVEAGQPASDHVRAALRAGAHVITANKGPVAFAYAELAALARSVGRAFRFEGAVMDGIPIFNLVETALPAVTISGFSGVVNSTTNFIITAMENGREFAESLAEMQAAGIAEADASLDVDGWDAAAKAAALANVLMGAGTTPQRVARSGIGHLTGREVRAATASGRRLRLVARARRDERGVTVQVSVEALPATHLFATLDGQQNALVFETDLLGEFAVVQQGGGLTQTAYALVSDLVAVSRLHRGR